MRNQPFFNSQSLEVQSPSLEGRMDRNPLLRGMILIGLLAVILCTVAMRLTQLQLFATEKYLESWSATRTSQEILPAHNGRLLSRDGKELAYDHKRFDVAIHYRWMEQPVDEGWLKEEIREQLSPEQRRYRSKHQSEIALVKEGVLTEKRQMWQRLVRLAGVPQETLEQERAAIQKRIERIKISVEKRRDEQRTQQQLSEEITSQNTPIWKYALQVIKEEVSQPPQRSQDEIIVAEELRYHTLLKDVSLNVVLEIESNPGLYPGLEIRKSYDRVYPQRDLASTIIGERKKMTVEQLSGQTKNFGGHNPNGYKVGTQVGMTGMESVCEHLLRGRTGLKTIVKNRRGEIISQTIDRPPSTGKDVTLTLHSELQSRLEALLDARVANTSQLAYTPTDQLLAGQPQGGCLLVLDIHSGEILAAASAPRPDLSLLVSGDSEYWSLLQKDPRAPLLPRLTHLELPPGSVYKAVTAIGLMNSSTFQPNKEFHCQGFLDRPNKHRCYIYRHYGRGHAEVTLEDAICKSCNVYFFHHAREMGVQPLIDWSERLGFGQPTGIELPNEKPGHLPRPTQKELQRYSSEKHTKKKRPKKKYSQERWYPGDTLGLAIGQSSLLVTPLQVARMMAAIANGGQLVTPTLIKKDKTSVSQTVSQTVIGLKPKAIEKVRKGLRDVVNKRGGTGYKTVRHPKVIIAGKTGTAEVGHTKNDHAWFAGYVPADSPRYAFVVVLENAGSGGRNAGPLAKQLVQNLLDLNMIAPTADTKRTPKPIAK